MYYDVVGIGSAWVNRYVACSTAHVCANGLIPGAVCQVDAEAYRQLCDQQIDCLQFAGGSVANTLYGLACLSRNVGFVGKASHDGDGLFFCNDLIAAGVDLLLEQRDEDMGTSGCLSFHHGGMVTKVVHLGVSMMLGLPDVSMHDIVNAKLLLVEADILDMPKSGQWLESVLHLARNNDTKIILVLSNKHVVSRHRSYLLDLLPGVDFVVGNEIEYEVLVNTQSVAKIGAYCEHLGAVSIMTRDLSGSVVFAQGDVIEVKAHPAVCVDATSAGDFYLSGFIHAYLEGCSWERCADLGAILSAQMCAERGSRCSQPGLLRSHGDYFVASQT
jgi:sugar/nucleoside kinase (ribokinase family)